MMATSRGIPTFTISTEGAGSEHVTVLSTSPETDALCELTSNVSLEDTAISAEVFPLDIPTAHCSQLRRRLQRELVDAGSIAEDPMWRVNSTSKTDKECVYDIARPDPSEEEVYRKVETSMVESSQAVTTSYPNKAVQIRRLDAKSAPETVPAMFKRMSEMSKDQRALAVPIVDDKPALKLARSWTFSQYYDDCILAAKGFIKCGLEAHHSVCILADPSPNWHIANMAAIMAGGKSVGIDQRSSPETCLKIVNHCSADIIVVDKPYQLEKILKVVDEMDCVKALVYCNGVVEEESEIECHNWDQLLSGCRLTDAKPLLSRMNTLNPASCCTIIYTTDVHCPDGKLRGVMLSHDNITWSSKHFIDITQMKLNQERVLSHMSLADINYQMMDIYAMIASGGCSYFVPSEDTVMDTLANVHPTVFLGGSKQWESIRALMQCFVKEDWKHKIHAQLSDNSELLDEMKSKLKCDTFEECVGEAFKHIILKAVGLEKCHLPLTMLNDLLSDSTRAYFQSMGLSLWEQYGMVETTGPLFIASSYDDEYMLTGKYYRRTQTVSGNKQLIINGRQVFMGYLRDYPATGKAMDYSMHYIKTGVCGLSSDWDSNVYITGRMEDMIVLKCGTRVAPLPLENAILKELPIAGEAVVIGQGRDYPTCVITLKMTVKQDSDQGSMRCLDPIVHDTLTQEYCPITSLEDLDDDYKAIAVEQVMLKALLKIKKENFNLLQRIVLLRPLPEDPFPSHLDRSKKREYVLERYGSLIEELYQYRLPEKCTLANVLRSI